MRLPFSIKWIYLIEWRSFGQKYKFRNKNNMVSAWRNFKNIFSRPLFTIIKRLEMLKFHPYSIFTGDSVVGFVIFWVLIKLLSTNMYFNWLCITLLNKWGHVTDNQIYSWWLNTSCQIEWTWLNGLVFIMFCHVPC